MKEINLHEIATRGSITELIDALLQFPNLINAKDEKGMTPLHKAAAAHGDRADIVLVLLNYGANPNIKDGDDWTPLEWADFFLNRDVVLVLTTVTVDAAIL